MAASAGRAGSGCMRLLLLFAAVAAVSAVHLRKGHSSDALGETLLQKLMRWKWRTHTFFSFFSLFVRVASLCVLRVCVLSSVDVSLPHSDALNGFSGVSLYEFVVYGCVFVFRSVCVSCLSLYLCLCLYLCLYLCLCV